MIRSKQHKTSMQQFEKLKHEVQKNFGRKIISTKDCEQLQHEIKDYTINASLGLNTIRRCFGIIHANTLLSKYSLDALANYCGYEDYEHFISSPSKNELYEQPINLTLIKTLYGENLGQQQTKIFEKLHLEIFEAILTDSSVFQSVFPKLVHYPLFQEYVLSFHPLIDKLNQEWYMKAIRVFTLRSNIIHLRVFGLAMEFLKHFLNDELQKCKILVDEMLKLENALLAEYPLVVWPQARLFASAYIYFYQVGNKALANDYKQKIKHKSLSAHSAGKKTLQQEQENSHDFLLCVCDYLSIAGDYEFVEQLLEDFGATFNRGHLKTSRLYNPYKVIVGIIKAEHLFHTGDRVAAKKMLKVIDLSKLTFEFKNFYTFRYLILQIQMSKNKATSKFKTIHKQAKALVKELGYKTFEKKLIAIAKV